MIYVVYKHFLKLEAMGWTAVSLSSPFFSPQQGHQPPIRACDKHVNESSRLFRQMFVLTIHTGKKIPCNCTFHSASPHFFFSFLAAKPFFN